MSYYEGKADKDMTGAARLRRAIEAQDGHGAQELRLDMGAAYEILHEVEEEVGRGRDAANEWLALRLDLDWTDETPEHYEGDGTVSCQRAIRSMCHGWDQAIDQPTSEQAAWAVNAFKYIWRWPLKGCPAEDLSKAIDCLNKALDTFERAQ